MKKNVFSFIYYKMEKMQGFKFGFIDNAIVAIFALLGIEIEKYFEGFCG